MLANILAGLALAYAIWNDHKERQNKKLLADAQSRIQKTQQDLEEKTQEFNQKLGKINSSESILPHLYLNLSDDDIKNKGGKMIFGIWVRNVGQAAAVNIQMGYENNDQNLAGMLRSENDDQSFSLYDYLSATTALTGETVFLSFCIQKTDEMLDFYYFKLHYSDLAGRVYEQEFKFGYGNKFQNGYSLNQGSFQPKLIEDIV
ncbi:hypothetical protein [Furfurilactobacillus siliginis]|nr:hypothetical protein [Furfurilactobacillus siliginis]GEK28775.1 hypothetical protein LSI01_10860 [Furfurilactobacillus siliginis]